MSLDLDEADIGTRLGVVEEHIRYECAHELDQLMTTFGPEPEWHNQAGEEVLHGHDAIRGFYAELFSGFPDFSLEVRQRHVARESVVVEGLLRGTQTGEWMGIKPAGKSAVVPFCAIFTFTDDDRLK
jgi:hypothetical protein